MECPKQATVTKRTGVIRMAITTSGQVVQKKKRAKKRYKRASTPHAKSVTRGTSGTTTANGKERHMVVESFKKKTPSTGHK